VRDKTPTQTFHGRLHCPSMNSRLYRALKAALDGGFWLITTKWLQLCLRLLKLTSYSSY